MEKQQPDISIITINYNGLKNTCELIDSLHSHVRSVSYEIIVVDNASDGDDAEILQKLYPQITVLKSPQNLGFSAGNNLGIKNASGKYILLLNNDTFIREDNFHRLIERLESSPRIGGVSPKIKFTSPANNIQFAGYRPLSPITIRNSLIGFKQPDRGQYDKAIQTPYIHGAATMLKKEIIEKVGLMPEIYFLYYEELDWSTQITRSGYQLWYEPRCTVFHKESQSTGQESYIRTFYLTRNRLLYAWRNRKGIQKWMSVIYQMGIAAPKSFLQFLFNSKIELAKAVITGNIEFIHLKNKLQ